MGIDRESEGFGSGGLGSAVGAEPLERIEAEAARSRLGWPGASTSLECGFSEAGLVSAYERGNGTQIVVTMLVVHVRGADVCWLRWVSRLARGAPYAGAAARRK
jgi:hypothetical protein